MGTVIKYTYAEELMGGGKDKYYIWIDPFLFEKPADVFLHSQMTVTFTSDPFAREKTWGDPEREAQGSTQAEGREPRGEIGGISLSRDVSICLLQQTYICSPDV